MIRQLARPCWYFDCDPWEEPHFPTVTAALEHEAEDAELGERDLRPVLRRPAACLVGECDRCGRPLADDEAAWGGWHFTSAGQVLAALREAGWLVRGGERWCPDCTTAGPTGANVLGRVPLTVYRDGVPHEVVAEVTACPELLITADRSDQPGLAGMWNGLLLVHRPTGRHVSVGLGGTVGVLHRVAELVAHLDWSSPDPRHYATGYAQHVLAAWRQAADEQAAAGGVR